MRLRLLPAVFVIGATLLVLKATDVTLEARAESAASDATPAAAPSPDQAADPAADDTQSSSAGEVDVLTSLAKRRAELDAREQSLDMRENLIKAAEGRVDGKITQLKQLQDQVQTLLVERDDAEAKQLAALVKTYSSMKPKDAAHIFNNLNDDVLLSVASEMKPDVLGGILAGMQADQAQKLTVRLANRLKLPEVAAQTPPPPPAQQLAATAPPVTTPAPTAPAPQAAATPAPQTAAPATSTPAPAAATAAPVKK